MAATPDTGGRGQIVSRADRIDPGAQHGGAQPCLPSNQNGDARQARQLIAAVGDRAVAASGREGSHSHPGRERRGEMDLAAFPRRPPPRESIVHRAHAEREEPGTNLGESESSSGGRPAKTPPPGKGAKREGRAARREIGGDSKAVPESTAAIYTANRSIIRSPGACHQGSNGTRQSCGANRHGDTAAANHTSQGGAGTQGDTANCTSRCQGDAATAGTRKPRGARRHGDTATTSRTSQGDAVHRGNTAAGTSRTSGGDHRGTANGAWQPRGARHRSDTAASNRTCFSGCAGRHGDTTASRRHRNAGATRTSIPGCARPA